MKEEAACSRVVRMPRKVKFTKSNLQGNGRFNSQCSVEMADTLDYFLVVSTVSPMPFPMMTMINFISSPEAWPHFASSLFFEFQNRAGRAAGESEPPYVLLAMLTNKSVKKKLARRCPLSVCKYGI